MGVRLKLIAAVSLSVALASLVGAQNPAFVPDPEVDFINTPESRFVELGILKKAEVLRLDLDLADTGQTAVFLAFKGVGSKSGPIWTAYLPQDGHGYQRIDGVQFREDFFRAGKLPDLNPSGGLLVLYPGKGAGNLVRYRFAAGKAQMDELRTLDYSNPDDQRVFEEIFKRKLTDSTPDEQLKNPLHKVIPMTEIVARSNTLPKSDLTQGQTENISPSVTASPLTATSTNALTPSHDMSGRSPLEASTSKAKCFGRVLIVVGCAVTGSAALLIFLLKRR